MKLSYSSVFIAVAAIAQPVLAEVSFNVAVVGVACGDGTTITCFNPSPSASCKGNFEPAQASIVVTQPQDDCHISLYPDLDQEGGVAQRLDTDTPGTCIIGDFAAWQSYGIFCD